MRYRIASRKVTVAMSFVLAVGAPLLARSDIITLQMPNIPGDAKFAANNGLPLDSIRLLTVGYSAENTGDISGGGGGAGKAVLSKLAVLKKFGESSAPLFLGLVTGIHFQNATISFFRVRQGVPTKYYTITLDDVTVGSQKWVGNAVAADSGDSENVELGYSRITLLDNATGSRACYDLRSIQTC